MSTRVTVGVHPQCRVVALAAAAQRPAQRADQEVELSCCSATGRECAAGVNCPPVVLSELLSVSRVVHATSLIEVGRGAHLVRKP
eukprot:6598673-Prymnesium_polylepis.2